MDDERVAAIISDLQRENDVMRKLIADSDMDCVYCGLTKREMSKCASGFPGCARADDMMIEPQPKATT